MALSIVYFANGQTTSYSATGTSGTLGTNNSFFGSYSGSVVNSSSSLNSFFGYNSGVATTSGANNDAFGAYSLYSNTTGTNSVAFGYGTLKANTSGAGNTALGHYAVNRNTTGSYNVGVGPFALNYNTTGSSNTAVGYYALFNNSTASYNTGVGFYTMYYNTTGASNTATGYLSLFNNTTGNYNTAVGYQSLYNVSTGSNNVAVGANAGPSGDYTNTISIGNNATTTASNTVVIGNSSMTSIGGQVGWSTSSDGHFKTNIKEDVPGIEFIKQLRPVSYTFDASSFDSYVGINEEKQADSSKVQSTNPAPATLPSNSASVRRTGFIAQEVEATVNSLGVTFSGVVAPQNGKDYYRLRYGDFVVPLVKAVQEFNTQIINQQTAIDSLTRKINTLTKSFQNSEQNLQNGNMAFLAQNFPNPFSTSTKIEMNIPETAQVATLFIYNAQGAQLKTIAITNRGDVSINLSSSGELAAGIYLYTLIIDRQIIDTKRMIIIN